MRFTAVLITLSFYILCVQTHPAIGMGRELDSGYVYFPDQAEYIKLASKCPDNTILWPKNRRCYKEGEEGPCNFGRVLAFDRRYLKPYCKDVILE